MGCAFSDLEKEVVESERFYTVSGKITPPLSSLKESVIVILYSQIEGKNDIVKYTVAADTGHFAFLVPQGAYWLAAFEDMNRNLSHDIGESVGYFGAPDTIMVLPKGRKAIEVDEFLDLDFQLNRTDRSFTEFPLDIDSREISKSAFVKFGHITTLDDKIFAPENVTTGYWKPLTSMRISASGSTFWNPIVRKKYQCCSCMVLLERHLCGKR